MGRLVKKGRLVRLDEKETSLATAPRSFGTKPIENKPDTTALERERDTLLRRLEQTGTTDNARIAELNNLLGAKSNTPTALSPAAIERADELDKMVTLSPTRADAYRKQLDDMAGERATLLRRLEQTGVSDNARIAEIDEKSAALDKLLNDPSGLERVARTIGGGAKQYGSSHLNTIGMVSDALGGTAMSSVYASNIGMLDEEIAALERQAADTTLTEAERQEARDALEIAYRQRGIYTEANRSGEATGKEVYGIADAVAQSGAEDIERAKQGLGFVGQLGVDLGAQGTQMLLDRALGGDAFSLLALGTRAFGGSAQEARLEGATREEAALYGLGNAAVEVLAERLFDGLAGLYGKGGADEIVERVIARISKNPNIQDALSIIASGGGESIEELISGVANPLLKGIYNDKSFSENFSSIEIGDVLYDMLVGGIMGGFGGTVETVANRNARKATQEAVDLLERMYEGSLSPEEQDAVEVPQNANAEVSSEAEQKAMQAAYDAGRANVPREAVELMSEAQEEAYMEGRREYIKNASNEELALENEKTAEYTDSNYKEVRDGSDEILHLRDGGERLESESSRGQVRTMEESAGRVQSWNEGSRPADGEAGRLTYGRERVSSASLGLKGGLDTDGVYLVEGGETEATAEARRIAAENGLEVVLYAGGDLHTVETPDGVRGYYDGKNRKIYVRVDDPDYTAAQIAKHEAGHDMIARGEVDIDAVRARCKEVAPNGNVDELSAMYTKAYDGIGMSPDEIWEECICDSLGDMNEFGKIFESRSSRYADAMGQIRSATNETKSGRASQTAEAQDKASRARRSSADSKDGGSKNDGQRDSSGNGLRVVRGRDAGAEGRKSGAYVATSRYEEVSKKGRGRIRNAILAVLAENKDFGNDLLTEFGTDNLANKLYTRFVVEGGGYPFIETKFPKLRDAVLTAAIQAEYDVDEGTGVASWTKETIESLYENNANSYAARISPDEFLSLTATMQHRGIVEMEAASEHGVLNESKLLGDTDGLYLSIDMDSGKVMGHEGRHRMTLLRDAGIESVPIVVHPYKQSNKNRTIISSLSLSGEERDIGKAPGNVKLENIVPLSEQYREKVLAEFGGDGVVRFSRRIDADSMKDSEGWPLTKAQQEFFKDSKVRDEDGNLLKVYHGTEKAGFTRFEVTDDIGYFFTSRENLANTYSGGGWGFAPSRITSWDEAVELAKEYDVALEKREDGLWHLGGMQFEEDELQDDGTQFKEDELQDAVDELLKYYQDGRAKYEVYLNIKNPFIIDGNGSNWDSVYDWDKSMVTWDELSEEQQEAFLEEYGEGVETWGDSWGEKLAIYYTDSTDVAYAQSTRDWVREAIASGVGYDGVIFRNIVDEGAYGKGYGLMSDVYVAFNSNQIKSVNNLNPTDDPDIRYSRRIDADKMREELANNKTALEHFGKTYSWKETGYLLLNGEKLDFSGKHEGARGGYRTIDHRDIRAALGLDYGGDDWSGGMVQFMREGNIRIMPESNGINLSVEPTEAQERALEDYISRVRGEVIVDLDDLNGNTLESIEYPRGTRASKVLSDIRNYFENGSIPAVSEVAKYRYSRRLAEQDLKAENEELREKVAELKRQFTRNKAPSFKRADIEKLARKLTKRYDSELDASEIVNDLHSLADNLLNETDYKDEATRIARKIINESSVLVNGEVEQEYEAIKKSLRGRKIAIKDKSDIADFNDFRKRNFGRFTLSDNGTPVDTLYEELRDIHGESYFPSNITHPADQLLHIADLFDNMQEVFENPFSYDMAAATESVANEIVETICNEYADKHLRVDSTYADRAAERVKKAEAREKKKTDRVRDSLKRVREERDEKIAELKEKYRNKEKANRARRTANELRGKIARHAKKLGSTLLHGTDKKHIPDGLKESVAALLKAINLESAYETEFGTDAMFHRVKRGESPFAMASARTTAFIKLREQYKALAGEYMFDDELLEEVIALADTPIATMGVDDLTTIWNALSMMEKSVSDANKAFRAGKAATISEAAQNIHSDTMGKKTYHEFNNRVAERLRSLVNVDMLTPEAFFHRLGSMGESLFRSLRDAQDNYIRIMKEVVDFSRKTTANVNVKQLEKEMHKVTLGGKKVDISTAQLMELYVLMQREQARGHIFGGGVVLESIKKNGLFKTSETALRDVTLDEVADAISLLSAEQISIAEKMQQFASNTLSEHGNEASMEVFNYKKFNEEFYWPIRSTGVKKTLESDTGKVSEKNKGFAKNTQKGAKNALKIGSIFDTFASHSSEMAHYASWLAVTEDINRIRNYKHRVNGAEVWTMEEVFNKLLGSHGDRYLAKLLEDITTGASGKSSDTGLTGGLSGKYKAAAVGANFRVIIQQPTSLLRAFDVIDPKWFANKSNALKGWNKAKKYAPIAQWKDWGYFDIGTGKQMKDLAFGTEDALDKVGEKLMAGAAAADAVSWGVIWNACEAEVKSKRNDFGTDAFYEAVAKRFAEVIDHTQVVDGILQRSQAMRNKSELAKMATSFMGEPTKQFNMLVSAIYDARGGDKSAKKKVVRAAATLILSGTVNALAQSIVDGLRDDDREKEYWEKVLSAFAKNEANMLNPVQYIPYLKDVSSLIAGYDVSRMDMESISEIINSAKALKKALDGEGKYSVSGATTNFIVDVARAFGIPLANIKRDAYAVIRTIAQESDNYLFEYEFSKWEKSLNGNKSHYITILYEAFKNDPQAYEIIYRDLVRNNAFKTENNTSSEAIASAMEKKMKEEQGIKSVDDLDERYLTPDQKKVYDKTIKRVKKFAVWNKANAAQRKSVEGIAYDLTVGNGNGERHENIIAGGKEHGLTEDEYLAYKLALLISDEPNKSGKLGTYTNDEKQEALKMLADLALTEEEKSYLKGH